MPDYKEEFGLTTVDEGVALNVVAQLVRDRVRNGYRPHDQYRPTLQQYLDFTLICLYNERLLWRNDLSFVVADDGKTFRWAKRPIPPEA